MPSRYTSKASVVDAEELAKNLDIKLPTTHRARLRQYLKMMKVLWDETERSEENMQARIRGNILMALSTSLVVLTTGNKSEMSVGYATFTATWLRLRGDKRRQRPRTPYQSI
jgi:NH3-dependent NAD+ synthetase